MNDEAQKQTVNSHDIKDSSFYSILLRQKKIRGKFSHHFEYDVDSQ